MGDSPQSIESFNKTKTGFLWTSGNSVSRMSLDLNCKSFWIPNLLGYPTDFVFTKSIIVSQFLKRNLCTYTHIVGTVWRTLTNISSFYNVLIVKQVNLLFFLKNALINLDPFHFHIFLPSSFFLNNAFCCLLIFSP